MPALPCRTEDHGLLRLRRCWEPRWRCTADEDAAGDGCNGLGEAGPREGRARRLSQAARRRDRFPPEGCRESSFLVAVTRGPNRRMLRTNSDCALFADCRCLRGVKHQVGQSCAGRRGRAPHRGPSRRPWLSRHRPEPRPGRFGSGQVSGQRAFALGGDPGQERSRLTGIAGTLGLAEAARVGP